MATLIQIRRGTSSQWSSANPVLASGELAISTDLEKIKIGDGSSTWSNLLYINLTPAEIQSAIDSSVSSVLDGAPALLDTLNELAAALGDDENFASTITNSLADKLDISTASSTYLTQANAASSYDAIGSASAAQTAAESYADSLAPNYDPAGSAATAEGNANSYTDTEISTHNSDTTSVHGIADTSLLATTSYVDTAESDAVSTANTYSDSLASNYDSSGSASAVASDLTDHENATTSVHGIADTSALATKTYADNAAATAAANLVDSAPGTLDTLNELAAALGDDPNFATTIADSLAGKQPLDADLTAISEILGTTGFLKKEAADTWSLDTNTYLTGNQSITLTGDATGSGTTAITVVVVDDSHSHSNSTISSLDAGKVTTGTLAVERGGTGVATSTGTGSVVLSDSPTFTGTVNAAALDLTTAVTSTDASHYWVATGSDGVVRPKTLANVQTEVVSNTAMQSNVVSPTSEGSTGIRKTTVSTSAPTGGADGDVWLVYA
jgi:hypothetical protein